MHRHLPPLPCSRLLWLALLVLGLIGAPVLSAVGATHDLFHDADAAAHTHTLDHADDDDAAGLLHAAMHCATCGGHTSALPPAPAMLGLVPAQAFDAAPVEAAPTRRPDTLLRPPISA